MQDMSRKVRDVLQDMFEHKAKEWEKLEKILLTVDGGILGLTVTFITGRTTPLLHPNLLKWSWALLVVALILLLLSYAFEETSTRLWMYRIRQHKEESLLESQWQKYKSSTLILLTDISNYGALSATIIGIIILVVFGFYSI